MLIPDKIKPAKVTRFKLMTGPKINDSTRIGSQSVLYVIKLALPNCSPYG